MGSQDHFRHHSILAGLALALMLAAPAGAFGQVSKASGADKLAASFDERYPAEPPPPPIPATPAPPAAVTPPAPPAVVTPEPKTPEVRTPGARTPETRTPEATREPIAPRAEYVAPRRVAKARPPRSRIVVVSRSFLDAGTEVSPGQRKFLDYAFPPTHTPMDTVQNTGGRVGWHNSPLPGPFFPTSN